MPRQGYTFPLDLFLLLLLLGLIVINIYPMWCRTSKVHRNTRYNTRRITWWIDFSKCFLEGGSDDRDDCTISIFPKTFSRTVFHSSSSSFNFVNSILPVCIILLLRRLGVLIFTFTGVSSPSVSAIFVPSFPVSFRLHEQNFDQLHGLLTSLVTRPIRHSFFRYSFSVFMLQYNSWHRAHTKHIETNMGERRKLLML